MMDKPLKKNIQMRLSEFKEDFSLENLLKKPQAVTCGLALIECIFLPMCSSDIKIAFIALLLLACLSPRRLFPLLFFINGFLILIDLHLMRVYERTFNPMCEQMLDVLQTATPGECSAYLRVISPLEYALFLLLILLTGVCVFRKNQEKRKNWKQHVFLWAVLLTGIVLGYPKSCIFRYVEKKIEARRDQALRDQKKSFFWHAAAEKNAPHTVIYLIGESHREKEFMSRWEHVPVPPNTISFRNMISQYGHTLKAFPMLLSRKKVGDTSVYFHESSIFKLFEEAGYETHFIHYCPKVLRGENSINFITEDAMFYHQYGTEEDKWDDAGIFPHLDQILKDATDRKKFIVIKMMGVHRNYEDRYPDDWDLLKPSFKTEKCAYSKENRTIFLNTYQNAMDYSIHIIREIFRRIDQQENASLLFFISDHGENIFDDGYWNRSGTRSAYHIPFLVHANPAYIQNGGEAVMDRLKLFSDAPLIPPYVFETLVSAAFIRREAYDPAFDLLVSDPPGGEHVKREVVFSDNSVHDYDELKK